MRILSITAQKPGGTGSGFYLTEVVDALNGMGHEQAVVAGTYANDRNGLPKGVEFFPVCFKTPALPFPITGMSDEMPYESTVYDQMTPDMTDRFKQAFLTRIREAVEEFDPELILCHHLYLLTAIVREAFPDRRICGICHGTDLRKMKQNPLWQGFIPAQIRKLDHVFCLHREQQEEIERVFGVARERITIAGSGYNSRVFHRLPDTRTHTGYRIAFAGKISEKKGVLSLLRALSYLPYPADRLCLSLAGGYTNKDYDAVQTWIGRCPYPVELLGLLPQDALARLLNACDLFVLPSFYEGLPLVLAEAMACGAKVVCTDLPGIREWMDMRIPNHGTRFIPRPPMLDVDTPAPEALPAFEKTLAAAIQEALEGPAPHAPDLRQVSWAGVAQTILRVAQQRS